MAYPFRHSICNEVFERASFRDACKTVRAIGYDGIEIAPFTLAEHPASIQAPERRQYRAIMNSEGLHFAGLHWLMVAPPGLHVTTPDRALRDRSWHHINDLIDLCADLGDGGVMVFGSPKQRSTTGGSSVEDATKRFEEGLAGVALHAMQRGVGILVEALPKSQCDVVTTLGEAAAMARRIGSPAVRSMFDVHNAEDVAEPHDVIVDRYFDLIRHVHVNELDGRHPGTGAYDFVPLLRTLRARCYQGWLSLEVFDFKAGAETIARESISYLRSISDRLEQ